MNIIKFNPPALMADVDREDAATLRRLLTDAQQINTELTLRLAEARRENENLHAQIEALMGEARSEWDASRPRVQTDSIGEVV